MLSIAQEYIDEHGTTMDAARAFAADLMRGDPARFKAGYTAESAIIATAEAFGFKAFHETVATLMTEHDLDHVAKGSVMRAIRRGN